ncbi:hypothetical protein BpHYR1_034075 [Brachionus plicatilis]|uniref:Uncharacterized protein n=1 Tax=Brachionus plicatilis TaxID=10195 RepID=A0A3M7R8F9_BRAPC|nr:hypothetical protein BpHYR1_034075 [Brachionus plicatilis]
MAKKCPEYIPMAISIKKLSLLSNVSIMIEIWFTITRHLEWNKMPEFGFRSKFCYDYYDYLKLCENKTSNDLRL